MLRLKKIQILGFKSFGDRTELTMAGNGIAAVVGPNGCGKSNILDAMSWVLGERTAKALRGIQMQDVIFAGTSERIPLGMAEVTLSMIDPGAYEGPISVEPELPSGTSEPEDWDEAQIRQERASEAEEIATAQQPSRQLPESAAESMTGDSGPQPVVLRGRRRRFLSTPQKGEISITRRLFRTGDSEYLLNGKLCRLRDIQDVFMGNGLGPDSYAIIAQEQIGQLLSTKPHERRAVIEEAAGIAPLKTKKRLAESHLESARQNLARIDDIFEEVTRQMNSLKRQAAKAERFASVREELCRRLRVVMASRITLMDRDQGRMEEEIAALTARADETAEEIARQEASQHTLTELGYEWERKRQEAQHRINEASLELERMIARERSNADRIGELEAWITSSAAELEDMRTQKAGIVEERVQQRQLLEEASGEAHRFRQKTEERQREARAASEAVFAAERELEAVRHRGMRLLAEIGDSRNSLAANEESLFALEREAKRLEEEIGQAQAELEHLANQIAESRKLFESTGATGIRLEQEIALLRNTLQTKRSDENALRALANQLRSDQATVCGRRDSLQAMIRNHGYATDTVRQLLKPGALGSSLRPRGTLADFLEVSGEYEGVVDEFLREELNYVVVESWDAAEEGVRVLKTTDGRATFLVHSDGQGELFEADENPVNEPGVTPLRNAVTVSDGFGRSLEAVLPKLRYGYLVDGSMNAERLALCYAHAYFLTPGGECFHSSTVTGGHAASEGPLSLKRRLLKEEGRIAELESQLLQAEQEADTLTRAIEELTRQLEALGEERRHSESALATAGAELRAMEADAQRIERRLEERRAQAARNKIARDEKRQSIAERCEATARLEAEHARAENILHEQQERLETLRRDREAIQQDAAQLSAELAGLEERRHGAEAAFERINQLNIDLERRARAAERQLTEADKERGQRVNENAALVQRQKELTDARAETFAASQAIGEQAQTLRHQLAELEAQLKSGRAGLDQMRDTRARLLSEMAKLRSNLEHLEETCLAELNVHAQALRDDLEIGRLAGEELAGEEEAWQRLSQRLEEMGPVNMMALDEYTETSRRHSFLDEQRKDLIESIASTQESIREIDEMARAKFDQALAQISENFSRVFAELFDGGQAYLRVTDTENQDESGLDIIASPPGKKLQNVLLLSGGEKALTALALLVGIFQFRPSPFCVLDEIDAPLDEVNVARFCGLMHSLSRDTQFVVITHSKRMMEAADVIYGVTMQAPGVSKVLSVSLRHLESRRMVMERR